MEGLGSLDEKSSETQKVQKVLSIVGLGKDIGSRQRTSSLCMKNERYLK